MTEPIKNLYPGVSAHLNSYLQLDPGAWRSFHAEHIVDLARTIRHDLPGGYTAIIETIFDSPQPGVTLYQVGDDHRLTHAVTRIEYITLADKPGAPGHSAYQAKKARIARSDLCLVEVDYQHHGPPVISALPRYSHRDNGAYPYIISISNPRAKLEKGKAFVYGFAIDAPIPVVAVPLAGEDTVRVRFDAAYNATFETSPYARIAVDYEKDPLAFDRYKPEDQVKLRLILKRIRERK